MNNKGMLVVHLKDDFGNSGTIEEKMILPYKGSPVREPAYILTLNADYENGLVYHVSVHPSFGDAIETVKPFSCGTFRVVSREAVA